MTTPTDTDFGNQDVFSHTIEARSQDRSRLKADVEAFLKEGGKVEEVPRSLRADPPKRPQNNYGRGSI